MSENKKENVNETATLKDGGHVYLKCSSCRKELVDIWITRPDEPFQWKFKAHCCYCGDESFAHEIKGGFHISGMAKPKPDDPEEEFPEVIVEDFAPVKDYLLIRTKKNKR